MGQYWVYSGLYVAQQYPEYSEAVSIFCEHDPTFIFPVGIIALNYILLNNSAHPWLINIRESWTPFWKMLGMVYLSSGFIVLPQSFSIAYMSYGLTHLAV